MLAKRVEPAGKITDAAVFKHDAGQTAKPDQAGKGDDKAGQAKSGDDKPFRAAGPKGGAKPGKRGPAPKR